ncbi:TIGR03808 family TAT-translocated repetitive protein [Hyphomicrobium methylovorum]|uniref:TIGR03808 family TAT-translocated repetitive protein n=1 Tax=Hyphomicrobium methylovorum TaxID=84 RepID=UPI0015E72947|nr:TIGR03808 family TAT-translocated repetitive protein [Hyphomicrobium methylovorum]MBA2126876.1 TIGR03808 family TAT-translocated repetitive protein [Hyphomicrobium methylovorum]
MTFDRRTLLAAGLGLGATATGVQAADSVLPKVIPNASDIAPALAPDEQRDQTAALQAAIDTAAEKDLPLVLPPGKFVVGDLRLRSGTRLLGMARTTALSFAGGDAFLTGDKADGLVLTGLTFDGAYKTFSPERGDGLITLTRSHAIRLSDLEISNSVGIALSLTGCGGRIETIFISKSIDTGLKSLDAEGLTIAGNTVSDCGNNGILVWRSAPGEDGTIVSENRISQIRNAAGGTGEYGNGINVFRGGSVLVTGNRITDCTYSAVRGNAASNIQIISNSCGRLGEVAIYAEFGFEGALIANNLIDTAAAGISVTNFNEGGRLAVVQGNLIRNLFRREAEPEDKRGEGIGIEADAVVSGNTIENAPTVGIQIGWGKFMRDVAATGNVIRSARVGISVTGDPDAGKCLIANNLISGATDGAIRAMNLGELTGPDLAREPASSKSIHVTGNLST